jgi:aryl-alcohol dehydrogenase-like predicted oxidoreductase
LEFIPGTGLFLETRRREQEPQQQGMKRPLGTTGLDVGPLAFGGTVLGWLVDERTSFALLDAFVASGFNLIDTADSYYVWAPGLKGGESETIIGNWLRRRGRRDDIVIATKVGEPVGPGREGLSRAHIVRSAEGSLKRLQTDHIDLYQSHVDDRATPLEETLEAYRLLVDSGKVRAIGASNYTASRLAEALETSDRTGAPRYRTLQTLYNLCDRADFDAELAPLSEREGLGVLVYRPLARGFLSGKYRSPEDLKRHRRGEGVSQYLNPRGFRIVEALLEVAASREITPAEAAIAWIMSRPQVTAAIAGFTSVAQVEALARAFSLQLDAESIERLNRVSSPE